jgi:hypothetical protein
MDAAKTIGNAEALSHLRLLSETITVVERPLEAIAAIQSRCQFYNYEIYQQAQVTKKPKSRETDSLAHLTISRKTFMVPLRSCWKG